MMARSIRLRIIGFILAALLPGAPGRVLAVESGASYAIAMHGDPALGPDFASLPYANPQAPKGGRLTLAYAGAFDSLNPYNVRALSTAQGLSGQPLTLVDW